MGSRNDPTESPDDKVKRQRKCVHKFDAWFVPHWDMKHKHRYCVNCDYVERQINY